MTHHRVSRTCGAPTTISFDFCFLFGDSKFGEKEDMGKMLEILTLRVGAPDDVLEECVLRRNQSTSSARHFAAYTNPRLLLSLRLPHLFLFLFPFLLPLVLFLVLLSYPGVLPLPLTAAGSDN